MGTPKRDETTYTIEAVEPVAVVEAAAEEEEAPKNQSGELDGKRLGSIEWKGNLLDAEADEEDAAAEEEEEADSVMLNWAD